jgi:hypothetical protein
VVRIPHIKPATTNRRELPTLCQAAHTELDTNLLSCTALGVPRSGTLWQTNWWRGERAASSREYLVPRVVDGIVAALAQERHEWFSSIRNLVRGGSVISFAEPTEEAVPRTP